MLKWIIKKVIIGKVNGILSEYKDDIVTVKNTLILWTARLEKVVLCFKGLLKKIDDGKLDADEVDEAIADIEVVIKGW